MADASPDVPGDGAKASPDAKAPDDPKDEKTDDVLTRAQAAYDRGDFGSARTLLATLPRDDAGAKALRFKLAPDRVAVVLAVVCAIAFVVIFLAYGGP